LLRVNLHCDGLITIIMWSVDIFINDFTSTFRREKNSFNHAVTIRPVHSLKVLQLSSDVNWHPILQ